MSHLKIEKSRSSIAAKFPKFFLSDSLDVT
jgi:hypothetical protein